MKYIALLRGINIGRKNRVKMADLVKTLESSGFENIKTYLQSGNVIFKCNSADTEKIAEDIKRKISQTFGLSINVIVRRDEELENIINSNPFIKNPEIERNKLHVTFLNEKPDKENISNLDINKGKNEEFEVNNKEIYLYLPNGYARTKLTNNLWEKKFNTIATTRNWKTVNKLLELAIFK
ncbi:MAG: DUF1697 domain-containing protein [Methanobacterium sp.]